MKPFFIFFFLFFFIVLSNNILAEEINPDSIDISKSEIKLKSIKKSLGEQLKKEKEVISEKNKIINEIEEIEKRILLLVDEINLLKPEVTRIEIDFLQTQQDIKKNEENLEITKKDIEGRLRAYQSLGAIGIFNIFFSSRTFSELFTRNIYLKYLLDHDNELKNEYKSELGKLSKSKKELEIRKKIMESRHQEINELHKKLEESKKEKEEYWEGLNEASEEYSRMISELRESALNLEKIVRKYKVPEIILPKLNIKENDIFFDGNITDFENEKGKLSLPLAGNLIKKNVVKGSKGIILGAVIGTEIRASSEGRVYYLGLHPGYGNLIIIDHGGGYKMMIAQAHKFFVELGSLVKAGELIGFSAGGAWIKEGVYVEIHKDNKPIDTKEWFDLRGVKSQ